MKRVVVTGMGAITPIGLNIEEFWDGFKEIIKPMSLAVMGKVMTIPNGAAIKNIPMDKVFETFEKHGFEVKTETS